MGRRLNISTPTVINTELVPLDDSFYLEIDGQLDQWYYDNTEQYAPNRKVTPLLIVPHITAVDKDTSTGYTPSFSTSQWFANEWNETQGTYVETEITNTVDSGSADYVKVGHNLLVKKNVSYSHAVTLRCLASYIDPRDNGISYTVEDSVILTTNRTADVIFPEADIISPSARSFNPLTDYETVGGVEQQASEFDFKAAMTNNPQQPLTTDVRRYPCDVDGTEEVISGANGIAPVFDIHYGDHPTMTNQEFMYRRTANGTLVGEEADRAYIEKIQGNTVAWNQSLVTTPLFASTGTTLTWNGSAYDTVSTTRYIQTYVSGMPKTKGHVYLFAYNLADVTGTLMSSQFVIFSGGSVSQRVDYLPQNNSLLKILYTLDVDDASAFQLQIKNSETGFSAKLSKVQCFDITLIYGAGNEPTDVATFEADYLRWFGKPLSYESYDAGSLRPVLMSSMKTTGFNHWDEEWEVGDINNTTGEDTNTQTAWRCKNYIDIVPNATYYVNKVNLSYNLRYYLYDGNKQFISGTVIDDSHTTIATSSNCRYLRIRSTGGVTSYTQGNICINISNPSKNGTYEPYNGKVRPYDVTQLKGRLANSSTSVVVFPDGMKKAGSVRDEIFVEDGVIKAVKRVGSVDLGSLNWVYYDTEGSAKPYFSAQFTLTHYSNNNIICFRYVTFIGALSNLGEKMITRNYNEVNGLYIKDASYTDAATFKAAMNGVMLYYELATPEEYILDPIAEFVWYGVTSNGYEVLADQFQWYKSGQGTDTLVVDAMYGEKINVVLRIKMLDGETLSQSKAYAALAWRTPDIDTYVQSENGSAVRSDTEDMTFGTIVNVKGEVLSEDRKRTHLAFNWKIRSNQSQDETDKGWGQQITIDASDLRNVKSTVGAILASTLVSNEVYLLGAYEQVTDNNTVVTDGDDVIFDRPID